MHCTNMLRITWTVSLLVPLHHLDQGHVDDDIIVQGDERYVNEIEESLHRRNPVTDQTHADKQDTKGKEHHSDIWIIMPGSV